MAKIVIVGPAFPLRGGIANFNEALARAYQKQGYEVELISFSLQYPKILFPGKTQFDNGKVPSDLKVTTLINSINPFTWGKTARYIKSLKPDFVLIRFWLPFMGPSLGTIAKKLRKSGIKVIAITDNVIPHESRIGDKQLTKYFVKRCDGFVAMSQSVLDDLNQFTDNQNKICSPHPIYDIFGDKISKEKALSNLEFNPKEKHVLFFGFVRKYKGLDLLIEAFSNPYFKENNIKLIVAGEFYEDEQPYINLIKKHNIESNVLLHNHYIDMDKVKDYFCASDIVAQTYKTATQSGVTQIAYHFERPMLVTNVGGLPEIVAHNKIGYVTEVDSNSIANSLIDFYKNKREEEFVENVKTEKLKFGWEHFTNKIQGLVNKL